MGGYWAGTKFVGFTITHDRARRTITVSMPGYMQRAVTRFNTLADNPGEHVPLYRRGHLDGQALPPDDTSPLLSPQRAKRIQEITGVVLYYARVVDPTLLNKHIPPRRLRPRPRDCYATPRNAPRPHWPATCA
jgi:hypothetical protein